MDPLTPAAHARACAWWWGSADPEADGPPMSPEELWETIELHQDVDESVATLQGRLQGVRQERDALRARVRQLLDQRDLLVALLQRVSADRAARG